MQIKARALCGLALTIASLSVGTAAWSENPFVRVKEIKAAHARKNLERIRAQKPLEEPVIEKRATQFLNANTSKFSVDPTGVPLVDFDIGESYAGLLPISAAANETRELFFWFFPSTNPAAKKEIAIWLNGGPGCSSLSGLLTENANLTNMVWVEQPVGVGYDVGTPNIKNEPQLAKEFAGWFKNFVTTFGMQGYKVYITGESYAGYYVPYIANNFVNAKDTTYYNIKGVAINDPIIGSGTLQTEAIAFPFLNYWSNLFDFNSTYFNQLSASHDQCYASYIAKYFTFPPPQSPFPLAPAARGQCELQGQIYDAAIETNPCFNIYHIMDYCPFKYGVLGIVNEGDYEPPGSMIYFNRTDVKQALHAPLNSDWMQCTDIDVFTGKYGDQSIGPARNGVLQNVIENLNNVIIGVGDLDFLLPTNGTLFALQNVTWNGKQGFQNFPGNDFFVPYHPEYNEGALAGAGIMGRWGTERGLTFYSVRLAGHQLPGYTPGAAYRVLETLLGRVPNLGTRGDFTTQTGNFGSSR